MSTTEQVQESKDGKVLEISSQRELNEFLNEQDGDYTKRRNLFNKHYKDAMSDSKTSAFSRTNLLDRDLGKPAEKRDITTGGHPINSVSFDVLENDSNTGE